MWRELFEKSEILHPKIYNALRAARPRLAVFGKVRNQSSTIDSFIYKNKPLKALPLNSAGLKNNGIPDCVPIKTITQRNRMYSRWIRRWVGRWLVGVTIIKPPSLINMVFFPPVTIIVHLGRQKKSKCSRRSDLSMCEGADFTGGADE